MILRFVFFGSSKTDEAEVLVWFLLTKFLVFVVLVDDDLLDILGLLVLGREKDPDEATNSIWLC